MPALTKPLSGVMSLIGSLMSAKFVDLECSERPLCHIAETQCLPYLSHGTAARKYSSLVSAAKI